MYSQVAVYKAASLQQLDGSPSFYLLRSFLQYFELVFVSTNIPLR